MIAQLHKRVRPLGLYFLGVAEAIARPQPAANGCADKEKYGDKGTWLH